MGALLVLFGVRASKEEAARMASSSTSFDAAGAVSMVLFLGALVTGLSLGVSFVPFGTADTAKGVLSLSFTLRVAVAGAL